MDTQNAAAGKVAWTIEEYCAAVGCRRTKLYQMIGAGAVEVRKLGKRTLVVTPPAAFIAALPRG